MLVNSYTVVEFCDRKFLTTIFYLCYIKDAGGDSYAILLIPTSIIFSYYFVTYLFVKRKQKLFFLSKGIKLFRNIENNYFLNLKNKLINLNFPYNITIKKYIFVKVFSVVFFFISFIKNNNLILSLTVSLIIFFIFDFLIIYFKRKDRLDTLVNIHIYILNLTLLLTASMPIYEALKRCIEVIQYKRFKDNYIAFVEELRIYNFDISKSSCNLLRKFNYDEVYSLINILKENKKQDSVISLLDTLKETISLKIYNNTKLYYLKDTYSIMFLTVLLLISSFLVVIYPISVQILNSLNIILS